jgi:hypothetical protein
MPAVTGYHLIANGADVSCRPGDIARFLLRARLLTGLHKIAPPLISEAHGQGLVLIAESHICIAIHGSQGYADIFSCRPFRTRPILALLEQVFGGRWRSGYFRRSADPPGSTPAAGQEPASPQ